MNAYDPILDQPQSIDVDAIDSTVSYQFANQEVAFTVDAETDLYDLVWPWADSTYVRSIRLSVRDPQNEDLSPLITRFYPGYQETILGSEGMIISKRLAVPLGSADDRAVMGEAGARTTARGLCDENRSTPPGASSRVKPCNARTRRSWGCR